MPLIAGLCIAEFAAIAVIADDSGAEIARASVPLADSAIGGAWDAENQRKIIEETLAAARVTAGICGSLDAVVVGLTGFQEGVTPAPALDGSAKRLAIVQFAEIAHIGALDGQPGIVVVAAFDSVALGTAPGVAGFVQVGGWGYPFGADGGAYAIGREAVRSALSVADRGEPRSQLGEAALAFFSVSSLYELQHAYTRGEITRCRIAGFARIALDLAARIEGRPGALDRDAYYVRLTAAHVLTEIVMTVDARLPPLPGRPVSYAGSVFEDAGLLDKFSWMLEMRRANEAQRRLRERGGNEPEFGPRNLALVPSPHAPELRPLAPAGDPLAGALLLARRLVRADPTATRLPAGDVMNLLSN